MLNSCHLDILQMRKLRPKVVKWLTWGHPASKGMAWNLKPDLVPTSELG